MKLLNKAARAPFQGLNVCQLCGRWAGLPGTECAHVMAKGAGGGSVIDHPFNLIGLGGYRGCGCHVHNHNTPLVTAEMLWRAVARRESGLSAAEVEEVVRAFRLAPKESYHVSDGNGGVLCGHPKPINKCSRPVTGSCPICDLLWGRRHDS